MQLLTHNSAGEEGRSLTHLLWRVLKTTRKAIDSSRHQEHVHTGLCTELFLKSQLQGDLPLGGIRLTTRKESSPRDSICTGLSLDFAPRLPSYRPSGPMGS